MSSHAEQPWWIDMRRRYPRKIILVAAIGGVLLLALCARSRWVAARTDNDHGTVDNPSVVLPNLAHDLGTISQGKVLRAIFRVENSGSRRLVLVEETAGCCDQTADQHSITVAPGDSQDITVEVDTARWYGNIEHRVHYRTNDPELPQFSLLVTAIAE